MHFLIFMLRSMSGSTSNTSLRGPDANSIIFANVSDFSLNLTTGSLSYYHSFHHLAEICHGYFSELLTFVTCKFYRLF